MQYIIYVSILVFSSFDAYAEPTQPEFIPPALGVSVDGMLQMVAGLLLVLFIIGAMAWLLKRFAIFPQAGSGAIKIVASASVGQKERVVIVEVEDRVSADKIAGQMFDVKIIQSRPSSLIGNLV